MNQSWINNNNDQNISIEFDDTTRAWNDWKRGSLTRKLFIHRQFSLSLTECTNKYIMHNDSLENINPSISLGSIDVPCLVKTLPALDTDCHICRKSRNQLYPCRTCGKVYHAQCIKDLADIRSYQIIQNATNFIGWSCPMCEDLRILLSPEDLADTNEWIQSIDDQATFTLDAYINTRLKAKSSMNYYNNELHDRIKAILKIFLHTITDIIPNRMTRVDLLMLDVSMKILQTPPKYLVNSLTPFELYRLSQLFISLSPANHQSITYHRFRHVFHSYLLTIMPDFHSNEVSLHLESLAYCFLGNSTHTDRTWTHFVLNATIPTLLERYNYRKTSDFINRKISIKLPSSPLTGHLIEHAKNHSISLLMNDILHKLKQTVTHQKSK